MKKTLLLTLFVLVACNSGDVPVATSAAPAKAPATKAAAQPAGLSGKVLETMDSAGYTYLKVQTASGDVWAVVPQTKIAKGAEVSLSEQMTMENFESKSLNRKFDRIVFATMGGGNASPMGTVAQHMSAGPAADEQTVSVEKAAGGKSVAEVWNERKQLDGKPVVVRGKVVKFLGGIMGKNWIHVRDGSGSAEKGDNDLTVTTDGGAKVGDVVTVSGIVRADKDFGAGYKYPVIVEEARIAK